MKHRSALMKSAVLLAAVLVMAAFAIGSGEKNVTFDHGFHMVDVGMACEDCHEGMMEMDAGGMARPGHDNCGMCHDVEDDCDMCHVGGDYYAVTDNPDAMHYPGFAHKNHEGVECTDCHGSFEESDAHVMLPDQPDCLTCHEDNEVKPATHRNSMFLTDHGMDAYANDAECAACHTQTSCDDCHQGENVLANEPHPPEWTFTHHLDTMYGQECLACHETRSECVSCHKASMRLPHDLGHDFANTQDGGTHAEEAEAFILACLNCHDVENNDPVCARCHK